MCYTWLSMKHTLICWEHNVSKRDAWVCYHENVEWFLIMRVWVSICVGCAWFVTACSRAHFVTLLYLRTSRPTSCLGVSHDNEEIRISENEPNIVDNRENRWLRWVQHSDPSYKDKAWGPIWQHPVWFPNNVTLWWSTQCRRRESITCSVHVWATHTYYNTINFTLTHG